MKGVSFLSKFTLICNVCFVLFAIFSVMEAAKPAGGFPGTVESIPFLKQTIIVLGFPAILINFLMCFSYCILIILGKGKWIPKWLAYINISFLFIQVYYFFFYK